MMSGRVNEELESLLREHIQTYEQLEVLLMLGRDPGHEWRADLVAAGLRLPYMVALEALGYLTRVGLLTHSEENLYRCHPDCARALEGLTRTYREDRGAVVELMAKHSVERLRRSAIKRFTAALRLKRDPDLTR